MMRSGSCVETPFARRLAVGILLPLVAGCAITLGARFDTSRVAKIQPGVTTQEEIQEMLGQPASEGLKNGRPLWTYLYAKMPIVGGQLRGTVLSIEFDDNHRVETYSYVPY
jgi:outer membrane protein assembly factor BamE (lipoprotein component of BamABCDE complex)